jgi:signal transduction histidine kinase
VALIERGLTGALSDMVAGLPLPVALDSTLDEAKVPPQVALAAYYVVNEALANVAKHASARHARVDVSIDSGRLALRIEDDGVGGADAAGNGLRGLRDRVEALDGTLRVISPPSAGTVVEALLPLDPK